MPHCVNSELHLETCEEPICKMAESQEDSEQERQGSRVAGEEGWAAGLRERVSVWRVAQVKALLQILIAGSISSVVKELAAYGYRLLTSLLLKILTDKVFPSPDGSQGVHTHTLTVAFLRSSVCLQKSS